MRCPLLPHVCGYVHCTFTCTYSLFCPYRGTHQGRRPMSISVFYRTALLITKKNWPHQQCSYQKTRASPLPDRPETTCSGKAAAMSGCERGDCCRAVRGAPAPPSLVAVSQSRFADRPTTHCPPSYDRKWVPPEMAVPAAAR